MNDKTDGMKWYNVLLFIPLFIIMIPCFVVVYIRIIFYFCTKI